jgi:hypothetical protein
MSYIDENFLFGNDPKNDKIQMILVATKQFFVTSGSGSGSVLKNVEPPGSAL